MISSVNPTDTCFWALDTPTTHQAIGFLSSLSGTPDKSRLETRLAETIENYPKMRQLLLDGYRPRWEEDKNFDLDNHIHWVEVPSGQSVLEEADKWFSRGLDKQRPLWKVIVLTPSTKEGNTDAAHSGQTPLLLFLVHHAFCDGMSGIALFYSLCDKEPLPTKKRSSGISAALRRSPRWGVSRLSKSVSRLCGDVFLPRPNSKLNGPTSSQRTISLTSLSLPQLNAVRKHFDLSMNELFLVLVTRAVRSYKVEHNDILADANILMPVNQRQTEDPKQLGNRLSAVRVPLPVSSGEIGEQIDQVRSTISNLKSDGSFGAYAVMASLTAKAPLWLRRRLVRYAARRLDFICTSAPGARKQHYIAGAPILSSYGLPALMHSQGIAYAFVRYCGAVHAAVVADPTLLNDSQSLCVGLQRALNELESCMPAESSALRA